MDWGNIWPIIGILGGAGGFLTVSVQEFRKWRSGAAEKERNTNRTLKQQVDEAILLRDWSDEHRRIIGEAYAKLRRRALEHGVPEDLIGPWPKTPPRPNFNK
ncbi:hypothetical protein ACTXOR_08605 [Arthrobacter rhombi]|uniref:hypothetical protein n=1 Tax=Arthrobacter rhombi TaxID=71253 RepID=UPI003FD2E91E